MTKYAEFLVGKIFRLVNPKGKLTTKQLLDGNDIAYVAAKKTNNGVAKMCSLVNIPSDQIMEGNCIVFVQQGDGSAGYTTYQPNDFYAISCVCCGYIDGILNEEIGLYLVSVLDKNKALYGHSYSWNGDRLLNTKMLLPIEQDYYDNPVIDPDHTYSDEGYVPDWDYMQQRIKELEQQRIKELEQYLIATGLNDYELTDEDRKTLSLSCAESYEKLDSEAASGMRKEMREFELGKLFEFKAIKQAKSQSLVPSDNGGIPYIVQSTRNNMFSRLVNEQWLVDNGEHPVKGNALVLGVTLPAVSYQPYKFGASQVITARADFLNEEVGIYLASTLEKEMYRFSYSSKPGLQIYKTMKVKLPIQTDLSGSPVIDPDRKYHPDGFIPDFEYMERYIKAIEKLVIKDVVKYKDEMIEKTKDVVAAK